VRIAQHDPGPSRTSKSDGLGDSFTSREPERRRGKCAFMCLSDSQAPRRPRVSSMAEVGVVETSPPARRCAKVGIRGGGGPRRASRTAACHSEDPLYKTRYLWREASMRDRGWAAEADAHMQIYRHRGQRFVWALFQRRRWPFQEWAQPPKTQMRLRLANSETGTVQDRPSRPTEDCPLGNGNNTDQNEQERDSLIIDPQCDLGWTRTVPRWGELRARHLLGGGGRPMPLSPSLAEAQDSVRDRCPGKPGWLTKKLDGCSDV
jgi:hypothetical protein